MTQSVNEKNMSGGRTTRFARGGSKGGWRLKQASDIGSRKQSKAKKRKKNETPPQPSANSLLPSAIRPNVGIIPRVLPLSLASPPFPLSLASPATTIVRPQCRPTLPLPLPMSLRLTVSLRLHLLRIPRRLLRILSLLLLLLLLS